jgi:hypothetical protein
MSGSVSLPVERDDDESPGPARRRLRRPLDRRRVAAGLTIVIVLGLVLAYSLWWTRPSTFTPVGNAFGMRQTAPDLHPVTFDMVQLPIHRSPETITVDSVEARPVVNTADALIAFAICQRSGRELFMSANGTAARSCDTVSDVAGEDVRLTPDGRTTITLTVTPRRPGRVVIRGMDVTYARGSDHLWQRGTQTTGPVVRVNVKG